MRTLKDELKKVDSDDYLHKAKTSETIKRIEGKTATQNVLERLGEDECPDETEYVGSIGCHVYCRRKLDGTFDIELHTVSGLRTESGWLVNKILRHLSIAVAQKHGFILTKKQKTEIKEL